MVRHSQQTPALQDTTPADQTSWHTDGHPNTTPRYLDGVVPSAVEKSACAEAETTKIRSVIYEMLRKSNSLKHERIVPLHARGVILASENTHYLSLST